MSQIQEDDKLYIITRRDLPDGMQLAQSCHIAFEFALQYPDETNLWMKNSNYICCLSAKDEDELYKLIQRAIDKEVCFSVFREPDIEDKITAIALEPGDRSRRLCSSLRLALK